MLNKSLKQAKAGAKSSPMTGKLKFMTDNGEVPFAYVDGYDFGDTLLEGVYFKVTLEGTDFKVTEVADDAKEYMKGLNLKKWLAEAQDFCKEQDIFIAPDMETDVWVVDETGKENPHIKPRPAPVAVSMGKWTDLIEKDVK